MGWSLDCLWRNMYRYNDRDAGGMMQTSPICIQPQGDQSLHIGKQGRHMSWKEHASVTTWTIFNDKAPQFKALIKIVLHCPRMFNLCHKAFLASSRLPTNKHLLTMVTFKYPAQPMHGTAMETSQWCNHFGITKDTWRLWMIGTTTKIAARPTSAKIMAGNDAIPTCAVLMSLASISLGRA